MKNKLLLFALVIITITCLTAVTVSAATYSGECGDNLTWKLDTSIGVLEIDGEGEMYNWSSSSSVPWYSYRGQIKSVEVGDSVTSIGSCAFAYCYGLTSVNIGDSVTSIDDWVFSSCDNLTSVDIPDSVTSIGYGAFENCDSLTSITVGEANTNFSSDEYGVLFNKDKTELIQYPIGNTRTSYTIPDSVTSIGSYAFWGCNSMTSMVIPSSVINIGFRGLSHYFRLTIYGYANSCAESYADENNLQFISFGGLVSFVNKNGDVLAYSKYTEGETVELPDNPKLSGYTFIGWSDGVSDELITDDFIFTTDIILTATYKSNEYVVVFDTNGGIVSQSIKNVTFGSAYGELPVPVREEYEFAGWFTENGKSVTETTIVNTAETHILYAKWTKVYSVKFLTVSGEIIASAEYKTDDKVIFPDVAEITGYTFAGWSYSTTGKIITGNVYVNSDIEFYARYNANEYMVVFIANGGSVSTTNKTVTYDSKYGELPVPVLEGYRFAGWYTSATGGEKISENTIVKTTEMQCLYAQWREGTFLYGDANADGKVDRKDLTRLSQYFARWDVEIDTDASDANGDGKVDRKDLTRLSQYFARWDVEIGK